MCYSSLNNGAQFITLLPHEYNVLYQAESSGASEPLSICMWLKEGSEAMERLLRFFQATRCERSVSSRPYYDLQS